MSSGISGAPESLFCSDQPSVECVFCAVFLVIVMYLHYLVHFVTNSLRMQNPGVMSAVCDAMTRHFSV